jgi:hypothetical protein
MGMSETGKWRPTFSDIVTVAALFGAAVMWFAPPNWEIGLPVVLLTAGAVIFTAFRHQSHPLLRSAISVAALIALFSVAWHPIWKDFSEKHPEIANLSVLRSAPNGPKLEMKVALTFLCQTLIDKRITPGIIIIASVTNTGTSQTVATNYRVAAVKDGNVYQGTVIASPKTVFITPFLPQDKLGPIQLFEEDVLYTKTATPIVPGNQVYGYLLVTFPNVTDYKALSGGYVISITFEDAFSNGYYDIAIPNSHDHITDDFQPAMRVFPGMHTKLPGM